MTQSRTAIWGAIALVYFGLMACATLPSTEAIAQPPQSSTETRLGTARVTFQGETPLWAKDAAAVMAALAEWRGKSFTENLQVTFQPQDDPGLNGWYNAETKQLVVAPNGSDKMGRGVLLHEIFHALQDQNFDLYQLRIARLNQPDANQALSAIIEGEAMLAVSELLNYNFLDHARLPAEGDISEALFEKLFVYGDGLKFIQAVRADGGWAAVDAVFQDPPQSTALILNPERYIAGERGLDPVEVPLKPGEKLNSETERGAYGMQWLIVRAEETRSQRDEFAEHYRGDRLAVIQTPNSETLHRWTVRFDSPEAAARLSQPLATALSQMTDVDPGLQFSVDEARVMAEWSVPSRSLVPQKDY